MRRAAGVLAFVLEGLAAARRQLELERQYPELTGKRPVPTTGRELADQYTQTQEYDRLRRGDC